jgi:PAS domain S-box-containing protein
MPSLAMVQPPPSGFAPHQLEPSSAAAQEAIADSGMPTPPSPPSHDPPGHPPRPTRRRLTRSRIGYLLAVTGPVIALAFAISLGEELANAAIGGFVFAALAASYFAGLGAGLIATLLSLPLIALVLPPANSLAVASHVDLLRMGFVAAVSLGISLLVRRFASAATRAELAADDAEALAAELRHRVAELQRESAASQARAERLERTTGEYQLVTRALSGARDAADAERRRIARLLGSVTDGFFTIDGAQRVTYANDALLTMWNRSREEAIGQHVRELFPEDTDSAFHRNTQQTLREQATTEYEVYNPMLSKHFAVKTVPLDDGASIVLRDISARVRAERDVRVSEARYRALVEASTRMVWAASADGLLEEMPFWHELTGQRPEESRGLRWLDAVHPADRARVTKSWRQAVESRQVYECEFRLQLHDGSHRWFHARGVPVLGETRSLREWVGVLSDVDAEHRAEQGRVFLERASEALVASLDVRGTLHTVVRLAVDGSTPLADSARVDLPSASGGFDCVAFESRDPTVASAYRDLEAEHPVPADAPSGFPRVIATGESELVESFDSQLAPRIEEILPPHVEMLRQMGMYSGLCVPLRARGETLGALTLVLHGPERRRAFDRRDLAVAEELGRRAGLALDNALRFEAARVARREAEQANRAKADFLAVMSHELRTPLNAIAGYAELLLLELRGRLTEEQRDDIKRIQRSQHHLLALVNDVLNFAKLDAGRVEFDIENVPVSSVLEGLDMLVAPQMEQKQLRYEVADCAPGLMVRADSEKLRQILLNLLSNAVKATPSGGSISIHCALERAEIRITVADTGRGIPDDKLERIFQPFVQLDRRLSSGHEGTGLGLAISRELARAMSGDLTVESTVGAGSQFIVSLPKA